METPAGILALVREKGEAEVPFPVDARQNLDAPCANFGAPAPDEPETMAGMAKKQNRFRVYAKRLLVLAGGTILACLLAEALVLVFLGEQVKFPRHVVGSEFGLRINQPNARYRHKSADVCVWFRINSKGLRSDVEYPYEKPPGTLRIVSLGDSFTAGYEVDVEECFSSVLERELRRKGYPVEVLNAGVSGYSTAEECLYLERELYKYDPDLVLVSYYHNDLQDNLRSGLFELRDGALVELSSSYVPLGSLANYLNTNAVFSFLSAYSNAFAYVKELSKDRIKKDMVDTNVQNLEDPGEREDDEYPKKLAAAIFQRIYEGCRSRNVPLVIQSIPYLPGPPVEEGPCSLKDSFPGEYFDVEQEGVTLLRAIDLLTPMWGKQQLYWHRSHRHWTPASHEASGRALAERIDSLGLLKGEGRSGTTEPGTSSESDQ